MDKELQERVVDVLEGMLDIAKLAMPDTYYATDSRCVAARELIAELDA
jgi:hypothetical protein